MALLHTTCLICNTVFESRTSYGLCSSCISRDKLREFDRWHSAIRQAEKMNVPTNLTLLQWMATISDHRGMCSFCNLMPHYYIEPMNPYEGLTWSNVVPACRSCSYVKRAGFGTIQKRIEEYLLANRDRSEDSVNLEFIYEDPDEDYTTAPIGDKQHD